MPNFISVNNVADILGASFASVNSWLDKGTYPAHINRVSTWKTLKV